MAYFERRVTKKGIVRWRVQVRRRGVEHTRTFRSKMRGQEWALQVEAGITGEARAPPRHTFLEAMGRYAAEVSPMKRGGRWERVRLNALAEEPVDVLFRLPMGQIEPDQVGGWRDRRLKEVAPATVRREMNLLDSVFERSRREWKWAKVNPFRDVTKPAEPPPRRRGVKDSELAALKALASTPTEREVIAGFELGIESGMRAGEMWGVEAVQVAGSVVHLERTKNGDSRDVALTPRALEIVTGLLADDRERLFLSSNAVRDVIFRRLRDAANLPDLHFHDSRSEAVIRLSKKLDVLELAEQIGHRDIRSLRFYYRQPAAERARRLAAGVPRTKKPPRKQPTAGGRRRR